MTWRAWIDSGRHIDVDLTAPPSGGAAGRGQARTGGGHRIFVRTAGPAGAPVLLLLHGFPTSSYDYAPIIDRLAPRYRCVAFDFLGFGASAKPMIDYDYQLQTRIVAAVAAAEHVARAVVVVHDYAVTVGQELLARAAEGRAPFAIDGMVFMNGGIAPQFHRPIAVQKLLAGRLGPVVAPLLFSERLFARSMAKIVKRMDRFDVHEHYLGVAADRGARVVPRLLQYIPERARGGDRWRAAIERTPIPLAFVWGLEDPISGARMIEWARTAAPTAAFTALDGIGHYPQLEDPDAVAAAIDRLARRVCSAHADEVADPAH